MPKKNRVQRCICWDWCANSSKRVREVRENRLGNADGRWLRREDFCQAEWDAMSRLEDHEMECVDPDCCYTDEDVPCPTHEDWEPRTDSVFIRYHRGLKTPDEEPPQGSES